MDGRGIGRLAAQMNVAGDQADQKYGQYAQRQKPFLFREMEVPLGPLAV